MLKTVLNLIFFSMLLFAKDQLILVVAPSQNSQQAELFCLENGKLVFDPFMVNIGRNGLATTAKQEGDGKTPAGQFGLGAVFGYEKDLRFDAGYIYADESLVCVDDTTSALYNQIVPMPEIKPASFEYMRRDDHQYELGVVVKYNQNNIAGAGSCIFLHVKKEQNAPTSGCVAMELEQMRKIAAWLKSDAKIVILEDADLELFLKKQPQIELR